MASFMGAGKIYLFLINLSGVSGFIYWLGVALCHYRFRKAYVAQGYKLEDLPYKAKWFPLGPIFTGIVSLLLIIFANSWIFKVHPFNWFNLFTYAAVPVFLILYFGFKYTRKTTILKLTECDFSSPTD